MRSKITEVKIFATTLSAARIFHRLTQQELANKLNVSRNTVGRWEKGSSLPDCLTYNRIRQLLACYDRIEAIAREYKGKND